MLCAQRSEDRLCRGQRVVQQGADQVVVGPGFAGLGMGAGPVRIRCVSLFLAEKARLLCFAIHVLQVKASSDRSVPRGGSRRVCRALPNGSSASIHQASSGRSSPPCRPAENGNQARACVCVCVCVCVCGLRAEAREKQCRSEQEQSGTRANARAGSGAI